MAIAATTDPVTGNVVTANNPGYQQAVTNSAIVSSVGDAITYQRADLVGDLYGTFSVAYQGLLNTLAGGEIGGTVGKLTTGLAGEVGNIINGAQIISDYRSGDYGQLVKDVGAVVGGTAAGFFFAPEELAGGTAIVLTAGAVEAGTLAGRIAGGAAYDLHNNYAIQEQSQSQSLPLDVNATSFNGVEASVYNSLYYGHSADANVNLGTLDLLAQSGNPSAYTGSTFGSTSDGGGPFGVGSFNSNSSDLNSFNAQQTTLDTQSYNNVMGSTFGDPYSNSGLGPYNPSNPGYGQTPPATNDLYLNPSLASNASPSFLTDPGLYGM